MIVSGDIYECVPSRRHGHEPNAFAAELHDRLPAIFESKDFEQWTGAIQPKPLRS